MDHRDQNQASRRTRIRAWRATEAIIRRGADAYHRRTHLQRLIPIGADELDDDGPATRLRILLRLARALRSARMQARVGHWTYDLNRHVALRQAYQAESRGVRRRPGASAGALS